MSLHFMPSRATLQLPSTPLTPNPPFQSTNCGPTAQARGPRGVPKVPRTPPALGFASMAGSWATSEAGDEERGANPRLRALPAGLALSAAAWLVGRVTVALSFGPARSPLSPLVGPWFRWDSINYLAIADHGRTFFLCHGHSTLISRASGTWCGVATWLPGYPALVSLLGHLGAPLATTMNLVSQVSWFLVLFVIWWGWGRQLRFANAALLLVACSVFPGAVYAYAMFPLSLTLALLLGAVLALKRGHLAVMALLLAGANFCYPSAWYATIGIALAAGILGRERSRGEGLRRASWALGGLLSIPLLLLHDQIVFGRFNAFFVLQAQSRDPHLYLPGIPQALVDSLGRPGLHVLVIQAAFSLLLLGGAAVVLVHRRRHRGAFDEDLVVLFLAAAVVLGDVLSASAGTWSRSILLALPALLCLRRLPPWILTVVIVASATITAILSQYFFNNRLI